MYYWPGLLREIIPSLFIAPQMATVSGGGEVGERGGVGRSRGGRVKGEKGKTKADS